MKKSALLLAMALSLAAQAQASQIVTSNIPLDSKYYQLLEKLEGMSFIETSLSETKPYSRLYVAKLVQEVENKLVNKKLPVYLEKNYNELRQDLTPELEAIASTNNKINNFKLREATTQITAVSNLQSLAYGNNNAKLQNFNRNSNGHSWVSGGNFSRTVSASGSFNKDLAVGLAGRFGWDHEERFKASLEEGYVKTHLGVWGIEVGKQALQWGGAGHNSAFAYGRNATPHTMVKLNLLEDHEFNKGFLRFLGKGNIHVFYSKMEGNRRTLLDQFRPLAKNTEDDSLNLLGIRAEIKPNKHWTIGLERVSMFKKFDKDWFTGRNKENSETENNNDIAGIDTKVVLPGVQFYAAIYGEDQAGCFPSANSYSAGVYFPQLAKDGSWDLRLEGMKTNKALYGHGTYKLGWTYKESLMGDLAGADSRQFSAELGHYLKDGSRLGLNFTYLNFNRDTLNGKDKELTLTWEKNISKKWDISAALGIAKVDYKDKSETSKLISLGAKWKF